MTYGEAVDAARRAASYYRARGLGLGSVLALIGDHDLAFYGTWLGALWIGAIPVVLPDPAVRMDRAAYRSRLAFVLAHVDAKLLAVSAAVDLGEAPAGVPHASYDEVVRGDGPLPDPIAPDDNDGLLLQHSSGTTGTPKGVLLTHGMMMRQVAPYAARTGVSPEDVVVSWLPLYHDLGMVGCCVISMCTGSTLVRLSPFEWVADPEMQLEAITEHRATVSYMPNFAFALLATTVEDPTRFDLSTLRALWSGGEPLTAESMLAFARHFEPAGFRVGALGAGYGMAESVCAIASSGPEVPIRFHRVSKHAWQAHHVAMAVGDGAAREETVTHVSNGTAFQGCEIRVVDAQGAALPPRHAGRVLLKTPYLFNGYFRREDLGAPPVDADGFYDSGDVGYLDEDGHVYVTGRLTDLIIVGGRNVYAQDVENVANEVPGVHPGRAVCFGVPIPSRGTEGAVLLFESDEPEEAWPEVIDRAREAVARRADVSLFDVRVAPRGALRKSTSGKLARADNRTLYLKGRFGPLSPALAEREGGRA